MSFDFEKYLVTGTKGWRPGIAPTGYINDKFSEKGDKKIFEDPDRLPLVRKMWDLMLTGNYSVPKIVETANKEWGMTGKKGDELSLSTGYKIFTNTFYYGEYEQSGEIHQGKHKTIITKEEYDKVQALLGKKGTPRPKYKRLPFNGIIKCGECGGMITADEKLKKVKSINGIRKYIYHKCTKRKKGKKCYQKPIKHEDLKAQIDDYLSAITIPEEFLHWAIKVLNEQNQIEKTDRNTILKNLHKNHQRTIKKIDNLIQLYISPSNAERELISEDEFKEQKNALMKEKSNVEAEIQKISSRVDEWIDLTEKTFNFATYAKHHFDQGDFETKTNILRALGQNFSFKDGKLSIDLQKPFLIIKNGLNYKTLQNYRFEPMLLGEYKRKNSPSKAVISRLSG